MWENVFPPQISLVCQVDVDLLEWGNQGSHFYSILPGDGRKDIIFLEMTGKLGAKHVKASEMRLCESTANAGGWD